MKTDRCGPSPAASGDDVELFLCGDVMLGRGIDQILPNPLDPVLRESYVGSAREYVHLAERAHGPIPRKVAFDYVWGDALPVLQEIAPSARIVNLETSVTTCGDFWPKAVNYRMHPANAAVLTTARIDCCTLANNHVLDFGREGLNETLVTLEEVGIFRTGAGHDDYQAAAPARIPVPGGRVVVYSFGSSTSGIPEEWAAGPGRSGVNLLPELSDDVASRIARFTQRSREPGDLLVASIHWGGNWGYEVPAEHRRFAHRLIDDAGFDVVHGHSSHHPKGIEIHHNRPILYGCGDFITDYEGIRGYETFRGDLALMYLPRFALGGHDLVALRLIPFRLRRFRLEHAPAEELDWLRVVLDRESRRFGSCVELGQDHTLRVHCHR